MMNEEDRPQIGQVFEKNGQEYRVTAIAEHCIIGTLVSVTGQPSHHSEITKVRR